MPSLGGIFIGDIALLEPDGHRTGMFKRPVATGRVTVTGLAGDHQADLRVHGGPDKALHHYAAENYRQLATNYPTLAAEFVPGCLGENLSTVGWNEDNVHIGDVFRIDATILEVCQPRSPCWKINHRFGIDDLSRRIASDCITGWYYRVLAPGTISLGGAFERMGQTADPVSIRHFWQIVLCHRPSAEDLGRLCDIPALTVGWKRKLGERKAWLARTAPH